MPSRKQEIAREARLQLAKAALHAVTDVIDAYGATVGVVLCLAFEDGTIATSSAGANTSEDDLRMRMAAAQSIQRTSSNPPVWQGKLSKDKPRGDA